MPARFLVSFLISAFLLLSGITSPAQSPNSTAPDAIRIVALAGDEVTLSAGANAGLFVGQELTVHQSGVPSGRIVVAEVETESAVGRLFTYVNKTVSVGDLIMAPDSMETGTGSNTPATDSESSDPDNREPDDKSQPSYKEHLGDIIPWERWEYLALSSLASEGLIPGYSAREFQGTRMFTRGQLAQFTATALENFDKGKRSERNEVLIRRLVETFQYQPAIKQALSGAALTLLAGGGTPIREKEAVNRLGYSVYGGIRYLSFRGDTKIQPIGRVGGILDVTDDAYVALSINNLHRLTSALPNRFQGPDVLTYNFHALDADWEIGKSYWYSGPVYSGDGLLSNNAPSPYMVKARKNFSWGNFPGKFVLTQIHGGWQDFDRTKYFGLRRVETNLGKGVEFGLAESFISSRFPSPLALVLPYYAYQKINVLDQDLGNDTFNYMVQADVRGKIRSNIIGYFEFVVDDIAAPDGLGAGFDAPRKVAWMAGAHWPNLWNGRGEARAEIYNSDRATYLGVAPKVSYDVRDLLLGSPFGPNTQAFFGRLDYRASDKMKYIVQLRDAVQFKNGLPDMGDRFELSVTAAYDPSPDRSVWLRVVPQRFRGQNYTMRETAVELMGTYAF